MRIRSLTLGGALALAACLLTASEAKAQDTTQKLTVTPSGADRMYDSLVVAAPQNRHTKKQNGSEIGVGWNVQGQRSGAGYWFVRGQLTSEFKIDKNQSHGLLDWIVRAISPTPSNQTVSFSYDKSILVYCDKTDPAHPVVTVSMQDAQVKAGTYNLLAQGKGSSDLKLPSLSVSSKSFGFSAGYTKNTYNVAVVGLPYVISPEVTLDNWAGTPLARVHMGLRWESQGKVTATPVAGVSNQYNLSLSYSGKTITGEVGSSNTESNATLSASGSGDGLAGSLDWDETEDKAAFNVNFVSDMSWYIDISGGAAPILEVGDAHWQHDDAIGWGHHKHESQVSDQDALPPPAIAPVAGPTSITNTGTTSAAMTAAKQSAVANAYGASATTTTAPAQPSAPPADNPSLGLSKSVDGALGVGH